MSIYAFRMNALLVDDPHEACYWGATEHPRYHDCEHCSHATDNSCEHGSGVIMLKELNALISDAKNRPPYPKLDPKRLP